MFQVWRFPTGRGLALFEKLDGVSRQLMEKTGYVLETAFDTDDLDEAQREFTNWVHIYKDCTARVERIDLKELLCPKSSSTARRSRRGTKKP